MPMFLRRWFKVKTVIIQKRKSIYDDPLVKERLEYEGRTKI